MRLLIFFLCTIYLFCTHAYAEKQTTTIIIPRPIGCNNARQLAGEENSIHTSTEKKSYGVCTINPEITLSFRPERLAQCLFGNAIVSCKNTFSVIGSRASTQTDQQWLADYFGLPTDFESRVEIRPIITNTLIDFNIFIGFDAFISGLYCNIHTPLVYSRWDLGLCETLISTGTNSYDPGYFNASGIDRSQLVESFTSFISGKHAPSASDITFNKIRYAKMSPTAHRIVQLGDIHVSLGWDIVHKPQYHCGAALYCVIPTANRPEGEFLFEPLIGNGHHWECGAQISAHAILWENEATSEHAGLYFEGTITHVLQAQQQRSFDIYHKSNNSRYMLAQRMDSTITDGLRGIIEGNAVEPIAQYAHEVTTLANLTTLPVNVSVGLHADLALMVSYTKEKNSWGLGYNFWKRSCEKITVCSPLPFTQASWALKGDAMVVGFEKDIANAPVALSATQKNSSIHHGLNFKHSGTLTNEQIESGKQNSHIDNPTLAVADSTNDSVFVSLLSSPGGTARIRTSLQPIVLTNSDIDINSARTRGQSNKIFSHFTHMISHELHPYLSIGAEIEFGQSAACNNIVSLRNTVCVNTAISLWGIWLKGGIIF